MENFRRLAPRAKAGRSHYQFKNWIWDACGKRTGAESVRLADASNADLINTCYANPKKHTETLYCIGIDLDAHRAEAQWKTKDGRLKWPLISKLLEEKYPELYRYIFAVVRSTSGKGLALYIAISPLELVPQTVRAQRAARALQAKLILLFNRHGLGADPAALGLKRDFCNWLSEERCVLRKPLLLRAVQASRTPVVRNILNYLKPHNLNEYVKKSEREGLLYPDLRAERKLAKLYCHLYENWLDGEKTVYLSRARIQSLTGLSLPFIAKFLRNPPQWLFTKDAYLDAEWGLTIHLDNKLTERAQDLAAGLELCSESIDEAKTFTGALQRPELVQDGNRNAWITKACLLLKHAGIVESRAHALMAQHVQYIPDHKESKNCKQVRRIVASIYSNHRDLFGVSEARLPSWLLEGLTDAVLVKAETEKVVTKSPKRIFKPTYSLGVNNFKEGGASPQLQPKLCKVSADQCFVFAKNFYTLPSQWVGKKVQAFAWEGKVRVYDESGKIFISVHDLMVGAKGQYVVHQGHLGMDGEERVRLKLEKYRRCGAGLGEFAEELAKKHGRFALRRFWMIDRFVKGCGKEAVTAAARRSRGMRALRGYITEYSF